MSFDDRVRRAVSHLHPSLESPGRMGPREEGEEGGGHDLACLKVAARQSYFPIDRSIDQASHRRRVAIREARGCNSTFDYSIKRKPRGYHSIEKRNRSGFDLGLAEGEKRARFRRAKISPRSRRFYDSTITISGKSKTRVKKKKKNSPKGSASSCRFGLFDRFLHRSSVIGLRHTSRLTVLREEGGNGAAQRRAVCESARSIHRIFSDRVRVRALPRRRNEESRAFNRAPLATPSHSGRFDRCGKAVHAYARRRTYRL